MSRATTQQQQQHKVVASKYFDVNDARSFSPSNKTVFLFFLIAGILSALFNRVIDCDESMNYWEPTHYLMFGKGLQTWEYSPTYALRSYSYLLLHALPGKLLHLLTGGNKITLFYFMKSMIALWTAIGQTVFFAGVKKRFGNQMSLLTFIFMLFSPAFFLSSSTYLPNTFSMITIMISYGFWMLDKPSLSVFSFATSVFMGWPFVVVLGIPLALNLIITFGIAKFIGWSLLPLILVFVPMVIIDESYYGKVVIAILNIITYNFTSSHSGGSQLYGIEDWKFYFINCILNFNIVFLIALFALPLILILNNNRGTLKSMTLFKNLCIISPFYIWFTFMSWLPHKEERFLFVIYPFICLSASIPIYLVQHYVNYKLTGKEKKQEEQQQQQENQEGFISKTIRFLVSLSIKSIVLLFILLSISRIFSTYVNYNAPYAIYKHLNDHVLLNGDVLDPQFPPFFEGHNVTVCVGKEWYRFPSNFFLPDDRIDERVKSKKKGGEKPMIRFNVGFVRSNFRGHLPKPFSTAENGTRIIPTNMNDQNKEEMDRYTPLEKCTYIVDFDFNGQKEERYLVRPNFHLVKSKRFLDATHSDRLARSFYIPFYTPKHTKTSSYILMENINLVQRKDRKNKWSEPKEIKLEPLSK